MSGLEPGSEKEVEDQAQLDQELVQVAVAQEWEPVVAELELELVAGAVALGYHEQAVGFGYHGLKYFYLDCSN